MILAAGLGTRLRPLTNQLPKPLVPIVNEPLLGYHLRQLAALGVKEVMINLHHLPQEIKEGLGDGSQWGVKLHYSLEQPEILGTGGGLAQTHDFFQEEEAFFFLNGDILHQIDLQKAAKAHTNTGAAATLLTRPHPQDGKTGHVGADPQGLIKRVPEMPVDEALTPLMFSGLHILTPKIFEYLDKGTFGCVLRTGYRRMIEEGLPVASHDVGGAFWFDIGTPQAYLEAHWHVVGRFGSFFPEYTSETTPWIDSTSVISDDAILGEKVTVGAEAHIGKGSHLDEVVVWPGARVPEGAKLHRGVVYGESFLQVE